MAANYHFFRDHVKRRGPGTIGVANDALFFQLKELLLGNYVLFRIEATGMGGDVACVCFYYVEDTMGRFVRMQVCAKKSRKGVAAQEGEYGTRMLQWRGKGSRRRWR
jgi:hypothetical protein